MKAPPRAQVVKNLKNGIIINLLGLGATLLGLQATVGVLVAKALTSSSTPYLQGAPAGFSPVLALDVFLVQVKQFIFYLRCMPPQHCRTETHPTLHTKKELSSILYTLQLMLCLIKSRSFDPTQPVGRL